MKNDFFIDVPLNTSVNIKHMNVGWNGSHYIRSRS